MELSSLIIFAAIFTVIGIVIFINSKIKSDCTQECVQGRHCTCRTSCTENQSSE